MKSIDYFLKNAGRWFRKHKPDIFTVAGLGGNLAAIIYTSKISPKTKEEVEQAVDNREKAIIYFRNYLPVCIMYGTSSAAILYSGKLRTKQFAELASAYASARKELGDISTTIVEEIGVEAAKNVKDKLSEKLTDAKVADISEIKPDKNGEIRCYDEFSGRYFYSTLENLKKVQNDLNAALLRDEEVFLNDYFFAVHLDRLGYGDYLGWHLTKGVYELIEFDITSVMTDEEGNPCLIVSLVTNPILLAEDTF